MDDRQLCVKCGASIAAYGSVDTSGLRSDSAFSYADSSHHQFKVARGTMVQIKRAKGADRAKIEQLIAEYHASEHVVPRPERIAWAVRQVLRKRSIGILLVAHEKKTIRGVALGTFQPSAELGLTLTIHDFYVEPSVRRKGVGNELAKRLLKEAKAMNVDHVDLEILPTNTGARAFWESMGFRPSGRILYSQEL